AAPAPATPGDHVGVHEQKDGRFYVGVTPIVGRVSGPTLAKLADVIEAHGSSRLRTTPHQKLVILDVPAENVEPLVAELDALGLQARPSLIRRGTIACTGIEFCKLAIVETKVNATAAVLDLEERLKGFELPHPIALHVNGCPNSCARIQTADIGLKGQLVTIDGEQVPGYQVHLGGGLASQDRDEPGLGRTVRGLKVAADGIADYVERVVTRFLADREADETFAQWAHRAEEEALQ
ncbi:nitrite/sulfite reductase, partial [Microbacterium sp. ZW CA_36]